MEDGPDEFPRQPCSASFLQLDTSFTCAVCHGLFDTPLLVKGCGHSFCSACIRQNMEFQERRGLGGVSCPSCRKPCDARDLLLNVALRDAADKYRACRASLVRLLHDSLEQQQRQERQQMQQRQAAKCGKAGRPAKGSTAQPGSASQQQVASRPRKLRPQPPQQQPSSGARGNSKQPGSAGTGKQAVVGPKRSQQQQQQQQGPSQKRQSLSRQPSGAALSRGSGSDSDWGDGGSSGEDEGQQGDDSQKRASSASDFAVEVEDASSSSSSSDGEGAAGCAGGRGGSRSSGPSKNKTRSKASLGREETIELLDSDSDDDFQHSGGGLSDAESLSPPAKRARRAEQQQQRGAQRAGQRPGSAPAAELQNGRRREQQKQENGGESGNNPGPAQAGEDREAGGDAAPQGAPPTTPQGFVRCPVCNKTVPGFYINSHMDACLRGGGALTQPAQPTGKQRPQQPQQQPPVSKPSGGLRGGAAAAPAAANGATAPLQQHQGQPPLSEAAAAANPLAGLHPRQQGGQQQAQAAFVALVVPAKLVPSLVTDKTLRGFLQKYGLPTDGKKKDMMERYNALRLAVETANDRQERVTYQQLSTRVVRQERQRASAGAAGVLGSVAGALLRKQAPAGSAGGAAASGLVAARAGEGRSKSPVDSGGSHTFKALEAALRARMAAKKAAAAAAAGAGAAALAAVPAALAAVEGALEGGEAVAPCLEKEEQQPQEAEGQQEGQVQATVSAPVLSQPDHSGNELDVGSTLEPRRGQSLPPGLPCGVHTVGDPSLAPEVAALPPKYASQKPQGTSAARALTAGQPVQQQQQQQHGQQQQEATHGQQAQQAQQRGQALPNAASLLRHGAAHGGASQRAMPLPSPAGAPTQPLPQQHQQPHPHQPQQHYKEQQWKEQQPPNSAPHELQATPRQPQHFQQGSHLQRGATGYHHQASAVVPPSAGACRMQAVQHVPHQQQQYQQQYQGQQQQALPGWQQPAQQGAGAGGLDHAMLSVVYDVLDVADSGDESW